jgi:hypothetical protein
MRNVLGLDTLDQLVNLTQPHRQSGQGEEDDHLSKRVRLEGELQQMTR